MSRSNAARAALLAALLSLPALSAGAQETIVDPDNPDADALGDLGEGGEETIFDPDNPDAGDSGVASEPAPAPVALGGGYVRGRWRVLGAVDTAFTEPDEDIYELHNLLDLRVRRPLSSKTSAVLEGRLRHAWLSELREGGRRALPGRLDDVENHRAIYGVELRDAYLSTRAGPLLLRVGQQRVVWGSAEITRPADVVNPLDLRSPLSSGTLGGALPTTPVVAVKADWIGDLGALQLVLVPFFSPHQTSLLSNDFAASDRDALVARQPLLGLLSELVDPTLYDRLEGALVGTELPEESPENASVGLRGSTTLGGVDLALGYLWGVDRIPHVTIDPALTELLNVVVDDGQVLDDFDLAGFFGRNPEVFGLQAELTERANAGQDVLAVNYRRWHVVTLDGATYLGPVGVRADVAATPERTLLTERFTSIRRPAVNSALNLSLEGDAGQYALILEGFWFHVFDAPPRGDPDRPFIFGSDYYGVAGGLLLDLEQLIGGPPLSLTGGGLVNARDGDAALSASVRWAIDGDLSLEFGGRAFTAPLRESARLTPGALFDENDLVFLALELGL